MNNPIVVPMTVSASDTNVPMTLSSDDRTLGMGMDSAVFIAPVKYYHDGAIRNWFG